MATPQGGLVQGLLQSLRPWMTGGSPSALDNSFSQYGGTQGLLDAMLQASPGSQGAAAFGRAMEGTQNQALQRAGARQKLAMGSIGLQQNLAMFPYLMGALRQYGGATQGNPPQGGPQGSQPQSVPAPPPLIAAPTQTGATSAAPPQSALPTGAPPLSAGLNLARVMALMGNPGAAPFLKSLTSDPGYLTQAAVAKNPITQDLALYRSAQDGGNQRLAQAMYYKTLKDTGQITVAAYNGAVTTLGLDPATLGVSTLNPVQGVGTRNGVEYALPGAPQTQGTLAAARSIGEAQGKVEPVGGIPVPLSTILGARGSSSASPASAAGSDSLTDLLRRGTYQKQIGEEGGRQVLSYQEAADSARNANYALDQMMADAKGVSQGPAAAAIEWGLKGIAGVGQVFGVAPPPKLSSYQELDKYANQVAFAATRQMGSREAAQIVHLQMQSNPNKELTATAFSDLAGSMKAMNSYIMAKNVAIQQAAAQSGNPELASAQWTKNIDPRVWDLTLSPEMGEKWAAAIGVSKIDAAWPYLSPEEQQALVNNIPMNVRKQWLASSTH